MHYLKRLLFLLTIILLPIFTQSFSTASPGDEILGFWYTKDKKAKIQIYKEKNKYFGKVVSADPGTANDGTTSVSKTPDSHVKVKNIVILKNFRFKNGVWADGTINDPSSGNTYSCKLKLTGKLLELRGYIGLSLFGRTEVWSRASP